MIRFIKEIEINEVKDEIYKEGFKTIEAAQVWAEEHLEDW